MQYTAINIQGNILSSEILEKIRIEDIRHQTQADFNLEKGTSIRDEIGIAWAAARAHWTAFKLRRERLKDSDTGTSETRQGWMIPFLRELGYDLDKSTAELINGKTYAISHRSTNRDNFPVHIVGINQSLDKRAEIGGTRLSPHALIQEYLNNHEHLYALVTNGRFLRLLRDATRLSRLSYLEFDLERIMEEDLFAEFAMLFRLLHITRMPVNQDSGEESVIEYYHQEALNSGSRIREKLSEAIEQSLKMLANGLLKHPDNDLLRDKVSNENIRPKDFYLYLLRLVYRVLFLLVIEERRLIYPDKRDEATNKKRSIYYKFYSINRLTKLAERLIYVDPQKTDLWKSLLTTFQLFENGTFGDKLDIKPLGSGLFASEALGILRTQNMDNGTLLKVLNLLVTFENENQQRVRVNYADLDVEEFGSVYEGLLEYDAAIQEIDGLPNFAFVKGEGRSASGSHYTPEELVKPLIKHSLEYVIEDKLKVPPSVTASRKLSGAAKQSLQEKQLLSITVCDVACGSGHILLSAARRIALELARIRTSEDQPTPIAMRQATRDVIKHCIYGVDYNPLAVELCKVALWLEAHNPGEPLNFLDHHIKCGNSIVGLANIEELENGIAEEAFKTLPGDDKEIVKIYREKNKKERKELKGQQKLDFEAEMADRVEEMAISYGEVSKLPEKTPAEVEAKAKAYEQITSGVGWMRLKQLADMQLAQFFIPKIKETQHQLVTEAEYQTWLNGKHQITGQAPAQASATGAKKRFFHWFLEFPAIVQKGGFDVILGNPPFLGGQRISGTYGENMLRFFNYYYYPAKGWADLVTYFLRRIYTIIKKQSYFSIITTNTISQGDTKEGGIDVLLENNGSIISAYNSKAWPGRAAVRVSLLSVFKGQWLKPSFLNGVSVNNITSSFQSGEKMFAPFRLKSNLGKCFKGFEPNGTGFIINNDEAKILLNNAKNKDVVFKYITGKDINNSIKEITDRWIIYFDELPLESAKEYTEPFGIIKERVKPERITKDSKKYPRMVYEWWKFWINKKELKDQLGKLDKVFILCRVTKTHALQKIDTNYIFSTEVIVITSKEEQTYCILQSTIHDIWAWNYSSTMKGDRRYVPTDCFENFPFPFNKPAGLGNIGEKYSISRDEIKNKIIFGLTKLYNSLNNQRLNSEITELSLINKTSKEVEKEYNKEVWSLWLHLQQTEGTCSWEEAVKGIEELRQLHKQMDEAVLEAYGWHEDSEKWGKSIDLRHDFYEVDYLPENDRVRYTIHPEARKEILKRLLLLNHERYEEEIKEGLHKKKDVEKFYEQKGEPVPPGTIFSDKKPVAYKTSKKKSKVEEPKGGYKQGDLF